MGALIELKLLGELQLNSKKLVTTATMAAAAVAGVSVATNAQADATPANDESIQQNAQSSRQAAISQAEAGVKDAQAALDSANAGLATAQTNSNNADTQLKSAGKAVDDQQAVVNKVQATVTSASAANSDAQKAVDEANKDAASATPENIAKAQQDIQKQTELVKGNQDKLTKAQADADAFAKNTVNSAQENVNVATTKRDAQQAAVDQAKTNVKNVTDILNNSAQAKDKAQNDLNAANAKVKTDSNAVSAKQEDVNNATTAKEGADAALAKAKDAEKTAQQAKDAKQKVADEAKAALDVANAAVKDAQAKVDAINDKLANFNTITLPSGYKEAMKEYITNGDNSAEITELGKDGKKNNSYKSNKEDQKISVDYNNLTEKQRTELSIFATGLVNQIQAQMGTPKTKVSAKSVEFANKVVDEAYNKPSWDAFGPHMNDGKSHNNSGLQKVSDEMGSETKLENMSTSIHNYTFDNGNIVSGKVAPQTMDSLKNALYNDIINMMFDDAGSRWGHALTFINFGDAWRSQSIDNEVMGVAFDKYGYSHFDFAEATETNGFGDNEFPILPNDDSENKLSIANNELQSAKTDQATKQKANDDAQDALGDMLQVLAAAQKDIKAKTTNAQTATDSLTKAQNDLASLQTQLQADQVAQKKAQAGLDSFTADVETKRANLQKANDQLKAEEGKLDTTQANLETANKVLKNAQDSLKQKKQAVENNKATLKANNDKLALLKNKLNSLQNAQKVLAAAQQTVKKTQKTLDAAQQELAKQQKHLAELKATHSQRQKDVDAAKAAVAKATEDVNDAKKALQEAKDALVEAQKTDADRYGSLVKIEPVTVVVGQEIPDPVIANDGIVVSTPAVQSFMLMSLPVVTPQAAGQLPDGTNAEWADREKVERDAKTVGSYDEDVLVTFPDKSTYKVKGVHLIVNPVTKPGDNKPTGDKTPAGEPGTTPTPGKDDTSTKTPSQQPGKGEDKGSANQPGKDEGTSTTPSNGTETPSNTPDHNDGNSAKPDDNKSAGDKTPTGEPSTTPTPGKDDTPTKTPSEQPGKDGDDKSSTNQPGKDNGTVTTPSKDTTPGTEAPSQQPTNDGNNGSASQPGNDANGSTNMASTEQPAPTNHGTGATTTAPADSKPAPSVNKDTGSSAKTTAPSMSKGQAGIDHSQMPNDDETQNISNEPAANKQGAAVANANMAKSASAVQTSITSANAMPTREQSQASQQNKQLPQTGNSRSSILTLAGIGLAAAASLFGLSLKKRENQFDDKKLPAITPLAFLLE